MELATADVTSELFEGRKRFEKRSLPSDWITEVAPAPSERVLLKLPDVLTADRTSIGP